jgi:hypothetical protein
MYIMAKTYQNLELFGSDFSQVLSILESRKYKQAGTDLLSRRLQSRSTPQRIGQCRKAGLFTRGLRKSSSLTNGIGRVRNKAPLKEYGIEARGLYLSCDKVNASILGTSGERFTKTERRRH